MYFLFINKIIGKKTYSKLLLLCWNRTQANVLFLLLESNRATTKRKKRKGAPPGPASGGAGGGPPPGGPMGGKKRSPGPNFSLASQVRRQLLKVDKAERVIDSNALFSICRMSWLWVSLRWWEATSERKTSAWSVDSKTRNTTPLLQLLKHP